MSAGPQLRDITVSMCLVAFETATEAEAEIRLRNRFSDRIQGQRSGSESAADVMLGEGAVVSFERGADTDTDAGDCLCLCLWALPLSLNLTTAPVTAICR